MVRHHLTTAAALTLAMLGCAAHADQLITYTGTILRGTNLSALGAHRGDTYTQTFIIKTGAVNHAGNNPILSKFGSNPAVTPGDVTSIVNFSGHSVVFTAATGASTSLIAANYWPSYAHGESVVGRVQGGHGNGIAVAAAYSNAYAYVTSGTGPLTSSQLQIAGPGFTNYALWKSLDGTFQGRNNQGVLGSFLIRFTSITTRDLSLPTPEPGQYAAFVIGTLSLFALIARKRKSQTAS